MCLCWYPLPTGRVRSHTPRGSPPRFPLDLIYILVVGGRELVKLSCLERGVAVRCRTCAQRGVVRARCLNAPGLWRAQNELIWRFAHCTPRAGHATCWLPAWSLYLLSYPLLSRAATAPVPRSQARLPLPVSGPPSWSTWQDINTTAANLGQISCTGIYAF